MGTFSKTIPGCLFDKDKAGFCSVNEFMSRKVCLLSNLLTFIDLVLRRNRFFKKSWGVISRIQARKCMSLASQTNNLLLIFSNLQWPIKKQPNILYIAP